MTRTLPAILLVAIALHQMARAEWSSLAPWKGGGFGMFASADRSLTRRVHAWAVTPDGPVPLAVPADLENARQRARALPDAKRLARLARLLGPVAREREPDATGVRVEVWRIRFTGDLALTGERLGEATVSVGGEDTARGAADG